jgi:hypothetical protein
MPQGKIDLYGFGNKGVNVTKSPLHLEDGELVNAQNVLPDPRGELGSIKTRDGLTAINGTAMSTPVWGIVAVAQPIVTTRTVYVGRQNSSEAGQGWNTTTDAFATLATAVTTPGSPQDDDVASDMDQAPAGNANEEYKRGRLAAVVDNRLYYASNDAVINTTAAVIRVFDPIANTDTELLRIPKLSFAGTETQRITEMFAVGSILYIGVFDDNNAGVFLGRVFKLDLATGGMIQLGNHFALASPGTGSHECPISLEYAQGRLWAGTRGLAAVSGEGRVLWIDPSLDFRTANITWTLDHELSVNANGSSANSMKQYRGNLYIATSVSNNAIAGIVEQRTPAGTVSSSLTGASATAYNGFPDLCVFQSNLYATYWSAGPTATIHKFDGSSWSTVFTAAGSQRVPMKLFTNLAQTVLYAIGYTISGAATNILLTTPDGTTWTDRSANVNDNNLSAVGELLT